jgi:hypothetical protein
MPSGLVHAAAELAAEHGVLLVMLSRARNAVILSRAQSLIPNAGNRCNTKESVYWQLSVALCTMPRNLLEVHIARYQRLT